MFAVDRAAVGSVCAAHRCRIPPRDPLQRNMCEPETTLPCNRSSYKSRSLLIGRGWGSHPLPGVVVHPRLGGARFPPRLLHRFGACSQGFFRMYRLHMGEYAEWRFHELSVCLVDICFCSLERRTFCVR